MKNINCLFLIIAAVTLVSCQKVIDIDLNSAASKYVIEGGVTNSATPYRIKITQSKNFSENNTFDGVDNAFVTIADNAGNMDTLPYVGMGFYESAAMTGIPGRTYYLSVKIDDELFTSTSTMPNLVMMDSLYSYNFAGFGDTMKIINVDYFDPASEGNWYRFIFTLNNDMKNDIIINSDEFSNGQFSQKNIFYREHRNGIETGDSVTVEMQCIDKNVYYYFFTLNQTISQSSAAPTNPISNISGGALGFFSANTVERQSIQIP